ncbi:hypothetical protein GGS23DRAFT_160483 [Durotheca rogersii]|uniref:uncharacterized protein n=1 Tax=Durotheca rogersii TaxID=419775 RepID=UPI00221F50C3|nr:uncharacterized protein GGS23DRAFT_160483 [Durotheca rogersii]KAI5861268.1 hypothetical protein GGS23DRAFT_160483 [Durotheca rogersii]
MDDSVVLNFYHISGWPVYYRASVGSAIKYLEVLDSKPPGSRYSDFRQVPLGQLPAGRWNVAQLVHDGKDDKLTVKSVEQRTLSDVMDAWSGVKVDHKSLGDHLLATADEALQPNHYIEFSRLSEAPAEVAVPKVIALMDPWYHGRSVLANDSKIRRLIRDAGISTRVLGHLTENDSRVIGFMLESVAARQAGIEHLEACRAALRKLHELGIAHGTLRRSSFLILEDGGGALLQGFWTSFQTSDQELLAGEMAGVEGLLQQPLDEGHRPPASITGVES